MSVATFLLILAALIANCFAEEQSYVQQPMFYNMQGIPAGPQGQKYVALTFDDGPHQVLTPRLMDILKKSNSKATFYVMGVKAALHPYILERAVSEGHEVANHVWDHPVLTKINPKELASQLSRTSEAIRAATSQDPKTMRPPYGLTNRRNNDMIYGQKGMTVIQWSIDTIDWQHPKPEVIVERVMSKVKNGDILLCHDIHANTINAMPALVAALKKEGYELVTASTLVEKWNQLKGGGAAPSKGRHLRAA
jgi:peptidoglycan/xylan/chitin deacetylase (PgdA/CDA1 family)